MNKCQGAMCGSWPKATTCSAFQTMGCDCSGCCASDTDLRCATEPWKTLNGGAPLENLFPFTEGYSGRRITDGGSDMCARPEPQRYFTRSYGLHASCHAMACFA